MKTEPTRYRLFTVKHIGPTNHKGARTKITDERFEKSKILSYDYAARDSVEQAITYLESIGIAVDGLAMSNWTADLLSKDFSTQLK